MGWTRLLHDRGRPSAAGDDDPYGLGLVIRETPLRTEAQGRQDYDWHTQRSWKIINPNVRNGLGTTVGYKLVPGGSFPPMLDPTSPVLRRARQMLDDHDRE